MHSREEKLVISRGPDQPWDAPSSVMWVSGATFWEVKQVSHETARSPPPSVKRKPVLNTHFILYILSWRGAHSDT